MSPKNRIGLLAGTFAAAGAVGAALLVRRGGRAREHRPPVAPLQGLDAAAMAERLGAAIRIPTVSREARRKGDAEAFAALREYLAQAYPRAHTAMQRETVAGETLLYTWPGNDASLEPVLLLAHQDVVPVDRESAGDWEQPPFSGAVARGYVWGRGALDDKGSLIAIMEAAEHLAGTGFQPQRTVLIGLGHDEELGGATGATELARLLAERWGRLAFVLDEGGAVVRGVVPGVSAPVAVIGIAEKGYLSVELVADVPGGHSSSPRGESAIGVLADAVRRLERHQLPARLEPPVRRFFEALAPHASPPFRLLYSNLALFEPLVIRTLQRIPDAASAVRTTTATTVFQAGEKDNVIPPRARAVVNFRILPGDSTDSVLRHIQQTVGDRRITVSVLAKAREPTRASPVEGEAFRLLARTAAEAFPGAAVAPYLMVAGTDSRHFDGLTPNVYRFMPFRLSAGDLTGIHGTNERVRSESLAEAASFYIRLIRNAA